MLLLIVHLPHRAEVTLETFITDWLIKELPKRRIAYARGERQINDFIDAYVQYEKETASENPMSEEGFYRVMVDLFLAGKL